MTQPLFLDARRDLFGGLIDYAGLFPPASLGLDDSIAEYREARAGTAAWMLGTFVVTASRLEELAGALVASMTADEQPWQVSVILDGDPATAAANAASFDAHMAPAAKVVGTEVRLPDDVATAGSAAEAADAARDAAVAAGSISSQVSPYLEVPPGSGLDGISKTIEGIDLLRTTLSRPLAAKLRCGGETPESFPEPAMVARFMVACRDAELPFKATAGLHHPVRHHYAEVGVMRHGFLNLLIAAALAESGVDEQNVARVVAEEDPSALQVGTAGVGWSGRRADALSIKQTRASLFRSYGSCSFDEPVEDLEGLGMLASTAL